MLITETVNIKSNKTKSYYLNKGYTLIGGIFNNVKVCDLPLGSETKVLCRCDICGAEKIIQYVKYLKNYNNSFMYTCSSKCSRNKMRKTSLEKFGVDNYTKSDISKESIKNIISKKNKNYYPTLNFLEKLDNYEYVIECDNNKPHSFNIDRYTLFKRKDSEIICTICNKKSVNISQQENEMIVFLERTGVDIVKNNRTLLNGKELDIFIPSLNLAIEFNGLYWHSELYKEKEYHLNKTLKCYEKGIQLLHIWEDEWVFKKDITKSIILNKLGKISEKVYARQCDIRVVDDSKLVRQFLDDNHIQGFVGSSIKLGLYYNNELVSLMTFGKRMIKKNIEFELLRFCNKINLNILGAASKLFTHFKKNYKFESLISYSDFRLFDGKMYEMLGFEKIHLSKPDYFWCKDLERKHRFNFNKQKLIKEGYDPNKTEVEIMWDRGYYRIWGCGQVRWEYK